MACVLRKLDFYFLLALLLLKEGADSLIIYIFILAQYYQKTSKFLKTTMS